MRAHRNLVPKLALLAMLAFFACGLYAVGLGGSAIGSPVEVLGAFGATIMFIAIVLTLATMFIAARRAYFAGSWPWFLAVILVWPACYLYTLVFNRGDTGH